MKNFHYFLIYDFNNIKTPCGKAEEDIFYCPSNNNIYINTIFLLKIINSTNMQGNISIAYILYHEWGHSILQYIYNNIDLYLIELSNRGYIDNNNIYNLKKEFKYRRDFNRLNSDSKVQEFSIYNELSADFLSGYALKNLYNLSLFDEFDQLLIKQNAKSVGDNYYGLDPITHGTPRQRGDALMSGYNNKNNIIEELPITHYFKYLNNII